MMPHPALAAPCWSPAHCWQLTQAKRHATVAASNAQNTPLAISYTEYLKWQQRFKIWIS